MLTKGHHLNERTGMTSNNVARYAHDVILLVAAITLLLPIACQENKNTTAVPRPDSKIHGPLEKTMKKETLTLESACLAIQRDLRIPPDSLLGKCLKKKEFTYDKGTGYYYSSCGLLDINLKEKVFYINRGPVPKGAPDIKGSFYFTSDGNVKARGDTP
jgi:hypothetical protein